MSLLVLALLLAPAHARRARFADEPQAPPATTVDITSHFKAGAAVARMPNGKSYACCCTAQDGTSIICELKDTEGEKTLGYKAGCGGLSGQGYHSWYRMPSLPKYADMVSAGDCVVPEDDTLAEALTEALTEVVKAGVATTTASTTTTRFPITDTGLVDVSTVFANGTKITVMGGTGYLCCCKKDDLESDDLVQCELTDASQEKMLKYKSNCGGIKGPGYHSWTHFSQLACMVPRDTVPADFFPL